MTEIKIIGSEQFKNLPEMREEIEHLGWKPFDSEYDDYNKQILDDAIKTGKKAGLSIVIPNYYVERTVEIIKKYGFDVEVLDLWN